MSQRPRKAVTLEPVVNGLRPTISELAEEEANGADRFALQCPGCGEVGRYRFALLARRAFEEHADEVHPIVASPLDQIRTLVDLAESVPGTWECELGSEIYRVHEPGPGQYELEVSSRGVVIDAELGTLDDARIVIGGHARVVSSALVTAAAVQLRHGAPACAVPLE
ncbi:hypothetical protein [Streptomyces rhizosphaericus]|uniref:hypothetical protein n=1 Tax=Streptomyces rhizosphaericus TaxID=114699 RepID=UPI00117EC1C0|nr:hypothetical protein [Streptomyces rhizosphaericus]